MSEVGLTFYIRLVLIVFTIIIIVINSGALLYFWKKIDIGLRCRGLGSIFIQIFILDELREFLLSTHGWRWRLLALVAAQFLILADSLFPLSRRKTSVNYLVDLLNKDRRTE
jgi:hypothetical protein